MALAGLLIGLTSSNAQTINIGPNQYAFQYTLVPNYGLFFNSTDIQYEFRNNLANSIFAFDANNGNMKTNLQFANGSDFLVGPNRYAFRSSVAANIGLFATNSEIQFLDASANPIFAMNFNNGSAWVDGNLQIGNDGPNNAGAIRWTGSDFEGYDGSSWESLTEGTPGPEGPIGPAGPVGPEGPQGIQGPQGLLPNGTENSVPFYNGTSWDVNSSTLRHDGNSLEVGNTAPSFIGESRLQVSDLSNLAQENRGVISVYRQGLIENAGPLTSWQDPDAAINCVNDWGNSYSAAVYGQSALDYANSAAILGRISTLGNGTFGALAYRNDSGVLKAGYFNGDVEITDDLEVTGEVTVSKDGDERAFIAEDRDNFYVSNEWRFGETFGGDNGGFVGDFVVQRGTTGNVDFLFWEGYFAPADDANKILGGASNRWSTIYSSNGTINTSDAREKKNIKEIDYGLETLMTLKPVSYEWKEDNMNVGTKLGFVAQDLYEVVPEVVVTKERVENRETGEITFEEAERMGVFYDDLIPVLTKAIQEQQGIIDELSEENETLEEKLEDVLNRIENFEQDLQTCCFTSQSAGSNESQTTPTDKAELGQNIPNPFSESTIIQYYLPENTANAMIRVTNMEGRPLDDIQLGVQKGANQVQFHTQGMAPGTYLYSLFVNGEFVSSKKMVVAN